MSAETTVQRGSATSSVDRTGTTCATNAEIEIDGTIAGGMRHREAPEDARTTHPVFVCPTSLGTARLDALLLPGPQQCVIDDGTHQLPGAGPTMVMMTRA